ncbi:flagellar basal-body rod protein FlgG [Lachnospiraceae bacterium XBB1006]|nr:flagellar basal-body rod protein FlgG [Lachnospiraceae bacterium XBB1006]
MIKGLYTAYTGMANQMNRMDVLTNNLANSATNGFKKEGATTQSFDALYGYRIKDSSAFYLNDRLGKVRLGAKIGENYTDHSQGALRETENNTDFSIGGAGFFAIAFTNKAGESSVKYTRDGAFKLTKEGYLVTKDGDYVLNQNGATNSDFRRNNYIRLDPNLPFTVDTQGNIYQNEQPMGKIGVVDIADYNYLEHYGENMYQLVEGGRVTPADVEIYQGVLEMSNVNVVSEMVEMITVTRAYESNQKVIQTIDETIDKAVNGLGRVG